MTNLEQALKVKGFSETEISSSYEVAFYISESKHVMFDISDQVPGEIKHHGSYSLGCKWEVFWVIDEHNQCWTDGDTGISKVVPVDAEELLGCVETWEARNNIRGFLGMKLEMPPWALEALKNGWEMPASFPKALYNLEGIEV